MGRTCSVHGSYDNTNNTLFAISKSRLERCGQRWQIIFRYLKAVESNVGVWIGFK
jgi:hypothetical protein